MGSDLKSRQVHIGCAGWSVASGRAEFAGEGSVLERYARQLRATEINSSFYRPHRRSTYEKWAASTPEEFRFSVKVPKAMTHTARLQDVEGPLAAFMEQVSGLGRKLGCLLVQLPPSLTYDAEVVTRFLSELRQLTEVPAVCEPRHPSWFTAEAEPLLTKYRVGRVAADPAPAKVGPAASSPGGDLHTVYYRWHGSPRMYYSAYSAEALAQLAQQVQTHTEAREVWVIFDNTAAGAGVDNALDLQSLLSDHRVTT